MIIQGSIKSSISYNSLLVNSVDIDCVDGTTVHLEMSNAVECFPSGNNFYSIESNVSEILIDDEEVDYEDSSELYLLLSNGSVFNINISCDEYSDTLTLRSLVCKLNDGTVVMLNTENSSINDSF